MRCDCCKREVTQAEYDTGYDHPVEKDFHIAIVKGHEGHWVRKQPRKMPCRIT